MLARLKFAKAAPEKALVPWIKGYCPTAMAPDWMATLTAPLTVTLVTFKRAEVFVVGTVDE